MNNNLTIERKTIKAMVHIYCNHQHPDNTKLMNELCNDCNTFLTYSYDRLSNCPNKLNKPNCKACTIHCYSNDMRTYARNVMRHSGKYICYTRPVLTFKYLVNKLKS